MRRPPSLSEGSIRFGDYDQLFDKKQPFLLTIRTSNSIQVADAADVANVSNPVPLVERKWYEVSADYALRFLLHLTLISFFETLFFFKFVSKDEDKGILQITNYYTQKVISGCSNFSDQEIVFLNSILSKLVNATVIKHDGASYAAYRSDTNDVLYRTSWIYFSGIAGTFVFISGVSLLIRFKIHWAHIVCENLVFVSVLGLYELMFFLNIIKKYMTTSPQEITMGFINGLEQSCKLLR